MRAKLHYFALFFSVSLFAIGAAMVGYLASRELRPVAVDVLRFEPLTATVAPGGTAVFDAAYLKRYDCAGRLMVDLDENGPRTGRIIHEQQLGNREPGSWAVNRPYVIPADAAEGPARLREVLIYDCQGRVDLIRSPWAEFTIKR